jgi:NitT/TauT family transport system substrate-binding protein
MHKRFAGIALALATIFSLGAGAATPLQAATPDLVTIGAVYSSSDAPYLIADKKGFFRDAGITVTFQRFDSGALIIAPLGAGQLDVGGGAPAAGIYNAVAQGINVRLVADRGADSPGYGFNPIMVRTDLVTSGKFKTVADIKGMRVAEPAKGSTTASELAHYLRQAKLTYDDVQHVYLSFSDQVAAFKNGSIDASVGNEPFATFLERNGLAKRVAGDDTFYPYQEISCVMYGGNFIKNRPDVAKRFMVAYLRGVRYYKDALRDGHLNGPNAADVIAILSDATKIDADTLRAMTPGDIDADGKIHTASLTEDYTMFKQLGLVTANVPLSDVVDMSFADAAAKQLGPYKPKRS